MHRYREKVRYRLMREHPEWSEGQIKEKISEALEEFRKSHKAGQKGQKSIGNLEIQSQHGSVTLK